MHNVEAVLAFMKRTGVTSQHLSEYLKTYDTRGNVDRFRAITSEMLDIYERKNRDYGSSVDATLNEDGLLASKIRLGDKYRRFSQLINNDAKVKDESIRDTLIDMANYAILTVMWMDSSKTTESTSETSGSKIVVNDLCTFCWVNPSYMLVEVEKTERPICKICHNGGSLDNETSRT